ncbi:beta-lactamase/transpeptidase-like protein [Polyplosphaeria fusca]|uniref:Beta-lactamase/transpeptidase-like protein n=1 Tax=Polyplosphaeria fusca TaxID=682080 RepID=A0A9P4R1A5_9PLEO|nr:beta-lactamase/transpeptidase-like protein [Polyplosphaeria fusca]
MPSSNTTPPSSPTISTGPLSQQSTAMVFPPSPPHPPTNLSGDTIYSNAMGRFSTTEPTPLTLDSPMRIGSLTQFQTSLACIIAIEKGLFTLDTNARDLLPQLHDLDVLIGFEATSSRPRKPITKPCRASITVRQLLTHTSGLAHDHQHEALQEWAAWHAVNGGPPAGEKPLMHEPGQAWFYGSGMRWVGMLIERMSGQTLEAFFQEHIWGKLGMRGTSFKAPREAHSECCGSTGLYSTVADCTKVLRAVARRDPGLMRAESYDLLTSPQLEDGGKVVEWMRMTGKEGFAQTWDEGAEGTFGFGSAIAGRDFGERRKKGSCSWSGLPGTHCWLDKESGVGGLLTTRVLPPGDSMVTELLVEVEKCVYKHEVDTVPISVPVSVPAVESVSWGCGWSTGC